MTVTVTEIKIATAHKVGDIVYPAPGYWGGTAERTRCVVTKEPKRSNEVNFVAMPCDADGNQIPGARGFKGRAIMFMSAADADVKPIEVKALPQIGDIVVPVTGSKIPDAAYVVTGHLDNDRVKIFKVGGDNGRFWKANAANLTVLDAGAAQAALTAI